MKFAASLLLAVTVSGPALAAGQLPRTVVPVLYEIDVQPDAKSLTFAGTETVTINVRQATRTMTLNAADLNVTAATFDGKRVRVSTDAAAQTLTVTLPATATVGQHQLAFKWTGKINQSAAGLFAIDYTNVDGSKARMLATQFEAPDARRFAPMWDEPSFKAKFRLSSTAPVGETAYSNMPATSVAKRADGSQLYRFGETPVMSSYLLFLGMGDVERRTVTANGTEIGVIARRGVIDQGDYALGAAKRLLSYYNGYFGQRYPLAKMDMIAGPGSSQFFSAMENWGAIFYFEPTLLFDPSKTAESGRQSVHVTVAHEMAHQWFGDLVTMAWWDDLWLNEGFASWMEGKATADLNPSWKAGASAVAFERESAMAIDATSATHPIVRKVETVDQIGEAFDGITYMKGQAVIGMMESTLGADVFRDGIRRYMAKYRYGKTVTNQLWTELSAASGRDIGGIARDFTLQGGVPLVTMTGAQCVGGDTKVSLSQGRFGLDMPSKQPQTWRVPLVVSTIGGGNANVVVTGARPTSLTLKGCGTVVLNTGKGSYTRATYDDAGHAAVVRDYGRLSLEDRLGTLGDDFALALGGYQPLDRYFAVQAQVGAGADPLEWSMVAAKLERLSGLLAGTPLEQPLRDRTRTLLTPVLDRIGFTARDGESPPVGNLRERLIEQLGSEGDANVMARARDYVSRMRNDPAALPGAIRQPILSTYAVNATPAEWDALLAMTKAERSPVIKNGYVRLLGASAEEANARRALALLKTDVLTDPQKASLLRAIAGAHADLAYDWAVANQATVDGFIEQSSRTGFIVGLAGGSKDPAMPAKVANYAKRYLPVGSRGPADRVIAQMKINREAGDRLKAATARWLAQ